MGLVDKAPGSVGASSSCRDCNAASCNTECASLGRILKTAIAQEVAIACIKF
ncbi:uncharacterized protein P174DRAFT_222424 [Aspergillus novofumigatus IBT 16806]|uniref:Uncharacterized protein n=1 Tax=Aspergillus novofumigatus (strain IBT 16806) TaxID=1392255 RepID=A0A2I1C662_ASPN1|nr:uncharacterized protein P174DRAFT_222424 [Aspergillus novofumigatus IBT 16806]PKX93129.1 hypothetical protein P174DRAFT_222424 [Aspergillus novofumigatus IBT 16806]